VRQAVRSCATRALVSRWDGMPRVDAGVTVWLPMREDNVTRCVAGAATVVLSRPRRRRSPPTFAGRCHLNPRWARPVGLPCRSRSRTRWRRKSSISTCWRDASTAAARSCPRSEALARALPAPSVFVVIRAAAFGAQACYSPAELQTREHRQASGGTDAWCVCVRVPYRCLSRVPACSVADSLMRALARIVQVVLALQTTRSVWQRCGCVVAVYPRPCVPARHTHLRRRRVVASQRESTSPEEVSPRAPARRMEGTVRPQTSEGLPTPSRTTRAPGGPHGGGAPVRHVGKAALSEDEGDGDGAWETTTVPAPRGRQRHRGGDGKMSQSAGAEELRDAGFGHDDDSMAGKLPVRPHSSAGKSSFRHRSLSSEQHVKFADGIDPGSSLTSETGRQLLRSTMLGSASDILTIGACQASVWCPRTWSVASNARLL
jgi:hypothetical protein